MISLCADVYVQFSMAFYQTYMARWPDYCHVAEAPNGSIMGYSKFRS